MRKLQKIWLWVSSILFILPEILWSPLGNFLYSFFMPTVSGSSQILRDNFLLNSKFEFLYFVIFLIQLISIIVFTINWVHFRNYIKSKLTYWTVLIFSILLSLVTFFIIYLAFAVSNINFP